MTAYQCPRHGTYERESLDWRPPNLPISCRTCATEAEQARATAQRQYDASRALWRRWLRADIPHRFRGRTVDNWRPTTSRAVVSKAVGAWAGDMAAHAANGEGLLLMGAPGVGKTHLLAGLTTAATLLGMEARYASWPEVWNRCRPPYTEHPEELMRTLASVEFLALDELGLRAASDKEQARLFELVDARYSEQLPTVVATNLTMADLNSIGERTADRLREACTPVVIPGSSYRQTAATDRALQDAPWPLQEPVRPRLTLTLSMNGEDRQTEWEAKTA
ncbi:MAG TPA: ATP-binding protein [Stenotrophomonas sp.]|nr:ATP-binding protein [Stenotrophomonas sp.]